MKRIKLGIISLIMFMIPVIVNAGSISVSSANTVIVGNNVTVSVKISNDAASWQVMLDYDKNYLDLVSSSAEAGGTYMVNTSVGNAGRSYSFVFKAKKSGNASVSISSYYVVDDNGKDLSMSKGSKSIRLMTQAELEATYSKDNTLRGITVNDYELTPAFERDTLEYTVTVPSDVTKVNIGATKNDGTATVSGIGEFDVVEGSNAFEISVTAQNGSIRKYTVTVVVEDLNPITTTIDGKEYTVIKRADVLESPSLYESTTVKIGEVEVPGFHSNVTNFNLVGLKNKDGKSFLAIYDEKDNTYTLYNELNSNSITLYVNDLIDIKNNKYIKTKIKIDDNEYEAYQVSKKSKFAILYCMNIETGNKDFYVYDTVSKTFILYDNELINELSKTNDLYLIIIAGFGTLLFLTLILLINSVRKNKKLKKPKELVEEPEEVETLIEEKKEEPKENEIIEEKSKRELKKEEKEKRKQEKEKKKEEQKLEKQQSSINEEDLAYIFDEKKLKKLKKEKKKNKENEE